MPRLLADHRASLVHIAKCAAIVMVIALLLEVFLFNMNFFRSASFDEICLDDKVKLAQTENGEDFRITSRDNVIEFHNLNKTIENIYLGFDTAQAAQNIEVDIKFTDEAHETYFSTTEYTMGVPTTNVATNLRESQYIYLQSTGNIESLRIEIGGDDLTYPILLETLKINTPQPFEFNSLRFMLTMGLLALIYIFRPKSSIYRCHIKEHPRKSKFCIALATGIEIVLLTSYLFLGSNLVGVATSSYNAGSWDGKSIVNVYETGGDNAQQYSELAKAMAHGQLYLEVEPPEWLVQMDNPYDKGARDEMQKQTGQAYLFDTAYYEGHYYVYFGVVPVLIFYLPFYLLTGASFPTAIGVLICCIAFILGCTALMERFARYHFKRVSLGLFLLLQIPLVLCSGVLYLIKFPTFYSLPIMMALAFTVWGLYCWVRGRASERGGGWYLAGSLCMALVVGCRPQLVVFSLLAFPLFWRRFITEKHILTPRGKKEFVCLLAPYFVVAAGIMWYNRARFGSPLNFGANYNLTVNDMTLRGYNMGRFLPALFAYFLQTPTTTGVFPWIQPAPFETTYMGQTIKEVTFGGIFVCLPILWILAFSRRILAFRFRQRSTNTIAGVVIVMLVSGVVVALLDAQAAGILQRYYADFSFMLLAASVLLAFIVNEAIKPDESDHKVFMRILLTVVAISVCYSLILCFVPETGWLSDVYPWAYQGLVEMVEFWT